MTRLCLTPVRYLVEGCVADRVWVRVAASVWGRVGARVWDRVWALIREAVMR